MKKKLIIFVVAAFLIGMTCSAFAATMSISNALAYSGSGGSTSASASLSTVLSSTYFLYPNTLVFSIGSTLTPNTSSVPNPVQTTNNATQPVPEPFTMALLGSGLVGVYVVRRKLR
jgi:hypothetical protein